MNVITSISPGHINGEIQAQAVESWREHGYGVYSLNSPEECKALGSQYPNVNFIPTFRTMEKVFGKPYVQINAMIDFAKDNKWPDVMLINSDIIINDAEKLLPKLRKKAENGIVILSRWDFNDKDKQARMFASGYDAFIVNAKYYDIYPQGVYSMGNTHWDYWIPYQAIKNNIPIYSTKKPIIYHKTHPVQYDYKKWVWMGRYFQLENDLFQVSPQQLSDRTYIQIKNKILYEY